MTVFDLALAGSSDEYAAILHRWASAVWLTWEPMHAQVRGLIQQRLHAPTG